MSRIKIETGYYYHIFNRGVDKRIVFENSSDYARFIHSLYFCNDMEVMENLNIRRFSVRQNDKSLALVIEDRNKRSENRLVDILCFSLMSNHYHLLIKQVAENGISLFMHRLGTAYTNFFNIKYERGGSLFQGPYKIRLVNSERYLAYLSKYIHLNPLEIIEPDWQTSGAKDRKRANDFLDNYKWSSYLDYIGIKNFPSVINKDLLGEYYPIPEEYKKFIDTHVPDDLNQIRHII